MVKTAKSSSDGWQVAGDIPVRGLGVLYIIDSFWPNIGGAELLVLELARACRV